MGKGVQRKEGQEEGQDVSTQSVGRDGGGVGKASKDEGAQGVYKLAPHLFVKTSTRGDFILRPHSNETEAVQKVPAESRRHATPANYFLSPVKVSLWITGMESPVFHRYVNRLLDRYAGEVKRHGWNKGPAQVQQGPS